MDEIRVLTNLLMLGIALILFSGLSTLRFLRAFKLILLFKDRKLINKSIDLYRGQLIMITQ